MLQPQHFLLFLSTAALVTGLLQGMWRWLKCCISPLLILFFSSSSLRASPSNQHFDYDEDLAKLSVVRHERLTVPNAPTTTFQLAVDFSGGIEDR